MKALLIHHAIWIESSFINIFILFRLLGTELLLLALLGSMFYQGLRTQLLPFICKLIHHLGNLNLGPLLLLVPPFHLRTHQFH
jgi:hypothetical protein